MREITKNMPLVEFQDIYKIYVMGDTEVRALDGVSFSIYNGEFVAIIGASGSGKSTLLHMCAGIDRPNSGSIVIRGNNITEMSASELSSFRGKYIGMVYQKHNLIEQMTAMENILVPAIMCDRSEFSYTETLKKLLKSLNLTNRVHHLPSELSGGQQQRVSIARALINNPEIIFADEPTGNLDRANADEVLKLLIETKNMLGQTLMMVTHDMSIAEKADRILVMDNGVLTPYKK